MRIFGNNGAIVKQEILKLLPKEYHESGNIASSKKASDLLPSRECDNRIELEAAQEVGYSPCKSILWEDKDICNGKLAKGFIVPGNAPFASSIPMARNNDARVEA